MAVTKQSIAGGCRKRKYCGILKGLVELSFFKHSGSPVLPGKIICFSAASGFFLDTDHMAKSEGQVFGKIQKLVQRKTKGSGYFTVDPQKQAVPALRECA